LDGSKKIKLNTLEEHLNRLGLDIWETYIPNMDFECHAWAMDNPYHKDTDCLAIDWYTGRCIKVNIGMVGDQKAPILRKYLFDLGNKIFKTNDLESLSKTKIIEAYWAESVWDKVKKYCILDQVENSRRWEVDNYGSYLKRNSEGFVVLNYPNETEKVEKLIQLMDPNEINEIDEIEFVQAPEESSEGDDDEGSEIHSDDSETTRVYKEYVLGKQEIIHYSDSEELDERTNPLQEYVGDDIDYYDISDEEIK
jgi:hypothetical protein